MYDYVIVTHIPAFYKVNLYNELAKKLKILVIFIARNTNEKRADDFVTLESANFSYEVLSDGDFQSRSVYNNIKKLRTILKTIEYKRILLSGWDLQEFWYFIVFSPKSKNYLALESTVLESNVSGIKGLLKKIFLSQIEGVFASGFLHVKLLKELNFKGKINITKGVGIINKPKYIKRKKKYQRNYLYIGRLSKVKNLEMLIQVFYELPEYNLTIVGEGEDKKHLQTISKSNVIFKPAIDNKKLKDVFLNHDIFILPSINEPWGLVVEEAIYFGLPVIVSENCGSAELIENGVNGYILNPLDIDTMRRVILGIDDLMYDKLLDGINKISLNEKDIGQIKSYL